MRVPNGLVEALDLSAQSLNRARTRCRRHPRGGRFIAEQAGLPTVM